MVVAVVVTARVVVEGSILGAGASLVPILSTFGTDEAKAEEAETEAPVRKDEIPDKLSVPGLTSDRARKAVRGGRKGCAAPRGAKRLREKDAVDGEAKVVRRTPRPAAYGDTGI
jgi:hypothetical protein